MIILEWWLNQQCIIQWGRRWFNNSPPSNSRHSNIYLHTGGGPAAAAAAVAMITVVVDRNKQRQSDILNSYVAFYVVYHYQSSSWLFRRSSNCTSCRIRRNRSGFAEFLEFRAGINTLDPNKSLTSITLVSSPSRQENRLEEPNLAQHL